MVWSRQRQLNQLRSTLREFYPAALAAFDELSSTDALAVLAMAPTPTLGRRLSQSKIAAALRGAGRQRRVEERAAEIQQVLRAPQLEAPTVIADAMGTSAQALVAVIVELTTQIARLEAELAERFEQHPDAKIIRSLPGLGTILGARVLGEFGDDPNRYADAKSRKNYAGTSPITKRPAPARSSSPATPATAAPPTPATSGPSPPSPPAAELEPSTTSTEPPETPTTEPSAPSQTDSSASSTAASVTERPTTNTSPGATATDKPLDASERGMSSADGVADATGAV